MILPVIVADPFELDPHRDERRAELLRRAGFEAAWSCDAGKPRLVVVWARGGIDPRDLLDIAADKRDRVKRRSAR